MKIRRLVPIALGAYSAWKRLSPQRKAQIRSRLPGRLGSRRRATEG